LDKRTKKARINRQFVQLKKNNPERWKIPFEIIQSVWAIVSTPMVFKKRQCVLSRSAKMHVGLLSMQNYDGKLLDGGQNNKSSMQFDH